MSEYLLEKAGANFSALKNNSYPGRFIIIGRTDQSSLIQVYGLGGRSKNSQNRVTLLKGDRVVTEPADIWEMRDPHLLIYNVMRNVGDSFIVSNGDQTDTIAEGIEAGCNFYDALCSRRYEPDSPNYTPRIAAICSLRTTAVAQMAILRKSPWNDACDRSFYRFGEIGNGFGYCISTYSGDGNPLPAFQGEPYLLPVNVSGDIKQIAQRFWDVMNIQNRVSIAVKRIDIVSGESDVFIINKYSKV